MVVMREVKEIQEKQCERGLEWHENHHFRTAGSSRTHGGADKANELKLFLTE